MKTHSQTYLMYCKWAHEPEPWGREKKNKKNLNLWPQTASQLQV